MLNKQMSQIGAMGRMVGKAAGKGLRAGMKVGKMVGEKMEQAGEKMESAKKMAAPRLKKLADVQDMEPMKGRF